MFFNILRFIVFIIISTVKLTYHLIVSLAKLIFYLVVNLYRLLIYILNNDKLRFPTLLFSIGLILRVKLLILFSIYYLYLLNKFAIKNNIYKSMYYGFILQYNELKKRSLIIKTLKTLSCENMLINNVLLEGEESSIYIYHLVITPKGLYNIVPYEHVSNLNENLLINNFSKFKELVEDIFPFKIPIINILATDSYYSNELVSDFPFKVLPLDDVPLYIENNPYKKISNSLTDLYSIILENKVWLIDKLINDVIILIKNNKRVVFFLFISPLLYIFYMFVIMFLTQTISLLSHESLQSVMKLFQP